MNIEITDSPKEIDDEKIISEIMKYNLQFGKKDVKPMSLYVRNSCGEIIAGLTGKTFWNWLHVEYLWVHESQRGNKLGSQLIAAAENEAVNRGCTGSTLDTFSFQAPDFYQELGYSIVGTLADYSGEHQRHYLAKDLTKHSS